MGGRRARIAGGALTGLAALALAGLITAMAVADPPRSDRDRDIETLVRLLGEGDHFKVRMQAAKALGLMKVTAAVPPLLRSLRKDPDHLVRGTAAWALGSVGHPGTVETLAAAEAADVEFVAEQAGRARKSIVARFPGNLPAFEEASYHLSLDGIRLRRRSEEDLIRLFMDAVAIRYVRFRNVDLGEELVIEDPEAEADRAESFQPLIRLGIGGGITGIETPRDRSPGDVRVTISLEARWLPPGRTLLRAGTYTGTAAFEGGPKPRNELDEDPLLEAEKAALDLAVSKGCLDLDRLLKIPTPGRSP